MTKNVQTIAETMDRHVLYQKSVQNPESEIEFITKKFKELRGREAKSIREDFAGTAMFAVEWCEQGPDYSAVAVDLDTDTLEWGREHNVKPAGADVEKRCELVNKNVLDYDDPSKRVDTACAFNFSYNILKQREVLVEYFAKVREGLVDDGVFFLDILGGTEAYQEALDNPRTPDGEDFEYVWEQAKFNPITHEMVCYIHFQFEDGSKMEKAFTYEWRLRTIPEIIESLYEAGFKNVRCYWDEFIEQDDEDDDASVCNIQLEYDDGTVMEKEFPYNPELESVPEIIKSLEDAEKSKGRSMWEGFSDADDEDEDDLDTTGDYVEVKEVENQETFVSYIVAEK